MWFGKQPLYFFTLSGRKKNQTQIFHRSSRRKSGAPVTFAELGLDENEAVHFRALSFSTFELPNHSKPSIASPYEPFFHRSRTHFRQKFQDCSSSEHFPKFRAPDAPPPHSLSINEARFHRFRPLTRRAVIRLLVFLFQENGAHFSGGKGVKTLHLIREKQLANLEKGQPQRVAR
jgi:hypothetical protein